MIRFHRKTRWHYLSSSKLSKFIRKQFGLTNPSALTMEGWAEHDKQSKLKAPFINWLTDEFFNKVQNVVMFIPDCVYSIKVFLLFQ